LLIVDGVTMPALEVPAFRPVAGRVVERGIEPNAGVLVSVDYNLSPRGIFGKRDLQIALNFLAIGLAPWSVFPKRHDIDRKGVPRQKTARYEDFKEFVGCASGAHRCGNVLRKFIKPQFRREAHIGRQDSATGNENRIPEVGS
jgi:hypothetical protein